MRNRLMQMLCVMLMMLSAASYAYTPGIQAALDNALKQKIVGPAKIPLLDQGYLLLPKDYVFINKDNALPFMQLLHNDVPKDFVGIVFPKVEKDFLSWFVTMHFKSNGYTKTNKLEMLKPEDLIVSIKQKMNAVNVERQGQGLPGIEVLDWKQKPTYDATHHQLSFGLLHQVKGDSAVILNQQGFALGRHGMFNLNLVTYARLAKQEEKNLEQLMRGVVFEIGKGYDDYVAGDLVSNQELAGILSGNSSEQVVWPWAVVGLVVVVLVGSGWKLGVFAV